MYLFLTGPEQHQSHYHLANLIPCSKCDYDRKKFIDNCKVFQNISNIKPFVRQNKLEVPFLVSLYHSLPRQPKTITAGQSPCAGAPGGALMATTPSRSMATLEPPIFGCAERWSFGWMLMDVSIFWKDYIGLYNPPCLVIMRKMLVNLWI